MATELQIAAIDKMEQIRRKVGKVSVSRAMRETILPNGKRYSPATAKNPKKLTGSKGFQEVYLKKGLTAGLITGALVDDIKKKPQNRLGEMRLGAEIIGLTGQGEGGNKTLILNITGESAQRYGFQITPQPENSSVRPA